MGSSGGGGGSSGAVSHSAYLEAVHGDWLNATGSDTIEKSITEVMDTALGSSPWTTATAYNPDTDITEYKNVMTAFKTLLARVSDTKDWANLYTQAKTSIPDHTDIAQITDATIVADVAAFADQLDDEIDIKVLPKFRRGMQDINAVVSSAFPIGEAIIEAFRDRDVAKYNTALRLDALKENKQIDTINAQLHQDIKSLRVGATQQMLQLMVQRLSWEENYARMFIEANRIKIVAKKEENDQNDIIDEHDAKWDLEVFQYGANVMAAISGGTSGAGRIPSRVQSAIGGALSGAAAGAMIAGASKGAVTGPVGAGIGAVLGLASGLL